MLEAVLEPSRRSSFFKIVLLIDELYSLSINPKHSAPRCFSVSSAWVEQRISRVVLKSGKKVRGITVLFEMGLIVLVSPARSTIAPRSATYRFRIQRFNPYAIDCPNQILERLEKAKRIRAVTRDPNYSWIEQSLRRLTLSESRLDAMRANENHAGLVDPFTDEQRIVRVTRGIYIEHPARTIPSKHRDAFLFDESRSVARLDMSCAHAVILPWLVEDTVKARIRRDGKGEAKYAELREELDRLRARLSQSDFYSALMPSNPRKLAKSTFLPSLNGAIFPNALKVAKELEKQFPITGDVIRYRRAKDKRNFSDELQGRVTNILLAVVAECRKSGIPCVPVTDELIVPFTDRIEVLRWMRDAILEKTGVRAKVDGVRG
tara:strand:- start:78 stop:1208 length:1131 start_codon:yes stop_codon:yes gene_type:complete